MQITVDIPDEIAREVFPMGTDPSREVLQLFVVSALREGRISESQAVVLLGMETRMDLWRWLKQVDPDGGYDTVESLEEDLKTLATFRLDRDSAHLA